MQLEIKTVEDLLRRVGVTFIVCIWILAPYLLLQRFAIYPVIWLNESSLDAAVPVNFYAIYPYLSFYLLLSATVLYIDEATYVKLMKSICVVALISHFTFFFFPTGISRDGLDPSSAPYLYHWLVSWELPRNCLPSLHASLATLATLSLWSKSKPVSLFAALWTVCILWSALALRQHFIIDLSLGTLLATTVWLSYEKFIKPKTEKPHPIPAVEQAD